jgi:NitT/TauT family transport system substrate-binding protein
LSRAAGAALLRALAARAAVLLLACVVGGARAAESTDAAREPIRVACVATAVNYALLLAAARYAPSFVDATLHLEILEGPELVRARFREPDADMALLGAPMAIEMFARRPEFRWIGLASRDGSALAVNEVLARRLGAPAPAGGSALSALGAGIRAARAASGAPVPVAVAHPLATQTLVLYTLLRDHGLTLAVGTGIARDVVAVRRPPANSPDYLHRQNTRGFDSAILQPLPWPYITEADGFGKRIAYSKDIIRWPGGHLDGLVIARDAAIATKAAALREVMQAIQRAGEDIEAARRAGGATFDALVGELQRQVPDHPAAAIREALRADLDVINYRDLAPDRGGLEQIQALALEAGIIRAGIDIAAFTDARFATPAPGARAP